MDWIYCIFIRISRKVQLTLNSNIQVQERRSGGGGGGRGVDDGEKDEKKKNDDKQQHIELET